jgi:hypothetical protein
MRRFLAACAFSAVAVACGGSSDKAPPPAMCPAPVAPSGTLAGAGGGLGTFTPLEMGALVVNPTTCSVGGTSVHLAGIFLGFPSFSGLCSLLQSYGFCFDKANQTIVGAQIANVGLIQAQTVPGAGTTYNVTPSTGTTPDGNGNFRVASVSYSRVGAAPTCTTAASSDTNAPGTGSITIDTITATQVTGSMNVTFADGSTLAGTFVAATAPISINVCQVITGCSTSACVQ